ncbi:hypothetical protein CW304_11485 [Bacillus sp. UFRGS-B20]|nr:hypothetical protein CW304_11485 [Bacillus sp. UFRGS-B20]
MKRKACVSPRNIVSRCCFSVLLYCSSKRAAGCPFLFYQLYKPTSFWSLSFWCFFLFFSQFVLEVKTFMIGATAAIR